ncbi:unnamed protein product [Didymodactylos carnosus]|uniref:Uncharacterized protein n=1 Tax=Didymodactylos carnosus TaxID=1234261 RepID=A0A815AT12_9BILA|nr:unnamed protein product [Didymodactylos carnosus]CAF4039505.1 unnamed protein product [Didymodactylos carnosus]
MRRANHASLSRNCVHFVHPSLIKRQCETCNQNTFKNEQDFQLHERACRKYFTDILTTRSAPSLSSEYDILDEYLLEHQIDGEDDDNDLNQYLPVDLDSKTKHCSFTLSQTVSPSPKRPHTRIDQHWRRTRTRIRPVDPVDDVLGDLVHDIPAKIDSHTGFQATSISNDYATGLSSPNVSLLLDEWIQCNNINSRKISPLRSTSNQNNLGDLLRYHSSQRCNSKKDESDNAWFEMFGEKFKKI